MTEIFITDIQSKVQANQVLKVLKNENPELKINFDLNEINQPFPCGHTVLRVENDIINSEIILTTMKNGGFNCGILEDKVCI